MQHKFSYKGTEINYLKTGEGIPVILIHGFGEDSAVWHYQVEFLKQHCMLIVPDLPGSGQSGLLHDKLELYIEDLADCMYALLQHEQIKKCLLIGHSMGGYITLAMVEKHPEIAIAFGLAHSTAFADSDEKKEVRRRGIETIEQYGAHAFIKTTTPNLFGTLYKQSHSKEIEELIERGKLFSNLALQQYYFAMMNRPDRSNLLNETEKPVLFLIGTEDAAVPLKDALRQCSMPNLAYIHVQKGIGHMGMWEAPDEMNNHLLEFINFIKNRK